MSLFTNAKEKTSVVKELLIVFGGVALLFAGSQIEIPLRPVPINLMTVAVMLIGLTYSPRRALESLLMWVGLGAAGFPVFSSFSGGYLHLLGPTAGYIGGSVVAAFLMALVKEKFELNSWISDALLCLFGTSLVFVFGLSWLSKIIGFEAALLHGFFPFILPGFVKAGLLCTGLQITRHLRKE